MTALSEVMKKRRKDLGLTLAQVADAVGVTEATAQRWESGNIKSVRHEKITQLASVLNVNPAELMGWQASIDYPKNTHPMPEMRKIPLVGTIACGTPILADQNIEEYVSIPKNIAADFALTCKGDSMINARIFDGDVVYIRQQQTVENGEIAAVLIDNEATLKRVQLFDDHIVLQPENPMYKPLAFWGEEMNTVRILGKAVAFTSAVI